jgi:L-ribulose-5-phosphate 3-epimerase
MSHSRRQFLTTAGALGAASAVPSLMTEALASPGTSAAPPAAPASASQKRVKLAVSTYSYWHFRDPKVPVETVIDKAAALNVEGIDVLHRQMTS